MTHRFLPDQPLPPYSYVPGKFPHPIRDPDGHSHGIEPPVVPTPESGKWRECRAYLRGIDLFNAGFYWEAHETWEAAWHACGRSGTDADFFKGLIKLAAAGVKAREENGTGVGRHARRAGELLRGVLESTAGQPDDPNQASRRFGLSLPTLIGNADKLNEGAPIGAEFRMPFDLEPKE